MLLKLDVSEIGLVGCLRIGDNIIGPFSKEHGELAWIVSYSWIL